MELQPIGDNRQKQSLTTALKNICRDYPAGGTVLRELLQNADDAGATEVRFFLDETTYPVDPLIDTALGKYQGPALLAYNNAVFTNTDFDNLSRLGNSMKINDGSTTGKFGRGFNSVYNWTDSPSIVTRERLLILDPHMEWSTGGPVYDFVRNSENVKIKNQMAPFQAVMQDLGQKLDGTIIRIPLRTKAQAMKSDISDRETTVSEVLEVLQTFASEFGDSGLLFMRNVEKLELGSAGVSIRIRMGDGKALRSHKLKVNDAVKRALEDPGYSFDHSFQAAIEFNSAEKSKQTTFMVHHSIQCNLIDTGLRDWAKQQKLIPWVAVAAQLPIESSDAVKGSLFTVLPLPIPTSQPVHIHGLFSISPDRARLYELSDESTQDQDPAKWNNWLLQGPVPVAWAKLLSYLAQAYPRQSAFKRWPQSVDNTRDPLGKATERLIEIIQKESLALWPTNEGYVKAQNGLLDVGVELAFRDALREARAPVIYVPKSLQFRAEGVFKDRLLCPQSLCSFMKGKSSQIRGLSDSTKHKILEYLLSKAGPTDYSGLEIFPFRDGKYRSIGGPTVFVHRDNLEETIFNLEDSRNLDLEKLSRPTQHALKQGCELSTIHSSIRYRSASCLREYCLGSIFKSVPKDKDTVLLGEETAELVVNIWTWISRRGIDILDKEISNLWLLPLSNGKHRKVMPRNASSQAYLAPTGEMGELMWKYDNKILSKALPLLDIGPRGLGPGFVTNLAINPAVMSKLFLKDARNIVFFLEWFDKISVLVEDGPDEEKLLLAKLVASNLPRMFTSSERDVVVRALTHLQIFQKVSWKLEGDQMLEPVLVWTRLDYCAKSIGLLDGICPIPEIDGVQFLVADASSHSKMILQELDLADCLESARIIQDHIIPAWKSGERRNWTSSCKEQVAAFILRRFSLFSLSLRAKLRTLPMVPVKQLNGRETSNFALAKDLIDPSALELKKLCFDDEKIAPKDSFFRDFGGALKDCGLKTTVDEAFVEQRVRCYASAKYPLLDVQKRAQELLKSPCRWSSPLESQEAFDFRRLKWVPATDLSGVLSLNTPNECRGRRDRLLVSSQLPILRVSISSEWEERLGWHATLSDRILLSQLEFGVQREDRKIVSAVLAYISERGLAELVAHDLKNTPCILAKNGSFVAPSQAVLPPKSSIGCERLQPYLTDVDRQFWEDHESLLTTLGIGRLQLTGLLQVQEILEAKPALDEVDVNVAIEILNLATKLLSNSLAGLKAISQDKAFHPIQDIYFDDLGPLTSKQKVNLTHQDIPKSTIRKLGIGSLSERLIKGMLELEDFEDEDEFDQRENVTTRIGDTLDRYPVETTFREYLANADDAKGASTISWLLDERVHPDDKLLTPKMKNYQGPAFLVRNDGVFSEQDFEGFKNVGEGSKAHDKETIGKFGRGSQTMYHWTDVPIILSGEWLLILDPQQQVLPWNQKTGKRKPGVKVLLSKVRDACRNQLAPFEGLWGYTQSLDHYTGTIFRFPLRTGKANSILRMNKRHLGPSDVGRLMATYFNEARISLLFLRKIKSIDFGIHGKPNLGWSIERSSAEDAQCFSELVTCRFIKKMEFGAGITGKDKWLVAIEDLRPVAKRLPENSRRVMKNVECGIAALISSTIDPHHSDIILPEVTQSKMFNTLPLPIPSDLPIHIHATFLLSGDRQSIATDEYGAQSYGSEWNRYLLQEELPKLYLSCLDNLVPKVRQNVFKFWPREDPPGRSCAELICTSFWKELAVSKKRLFPKAQHSGEFSQRRPPEVFDISQAVFDFLPKTQSEILAPLLMSLDINLVCDVPPEVVKRLKKLSEVKLVTGSLLRSLFKSDKARICLSDEMEKNSRVLEVLLRQLLPTDDDLKDLDGCQILPLADGSLAALKFTENNDFQSPMYYVASDEELTLFEFASKLLVPSNIGTMFKSVLASAKFNLSKLRLCNVRDLLKLRPRISTPNPEDDKWLTEFWEYWNGSIDSSFHSSNIETLTVDIFRATRDGIEQYISPAAFDDLAAVVEPSVAEHQQLCSKIPGLYRFNTKFMPKSLIDVEPSFSTKNSFYRLIRALGRLAKLAGIGIGTFVEANLDETHVKILRDLIIRHVSYETSGGESKLFLKLSSDLKWIPLWPRFHPSSPKHLLPANHALVAGNHRLLVPWMKECHRFVNHLFASDPLNHMCLSNLGVRKILVEQLLGDHVLPLPSTLSDTHWEYFKPLIAAISESPSIYSSNTVLPLLAGSKIAADGDRNLKKADDLYDHEDQIFTSAFRKKKETRFLHDSVRSYRTFWLKVGLRHRSGNSIHSAHYIQCLQEIRGRLVSRDAPNDPHLSQDSRTVLSLMTTVNSITHRFSAQDWRVISNEAVFQSRTGFNTESEYRQNTMASVATQHQLLCLSDIVSHEHVAVCWSQTPFALLEPTREVLSKVSGNGQPAIKMVWEHLKHMASIARDLTRYQARDFLSDLHLTYEYLQDHLNESKTHFDASLKNSAVWLNLDTTDHKRELLYDIKVSWHAVGQLVLSSSCDAGPIKAVRPGLMRYEKLLRALGCISITYPTITRPALHLGSSISSSLRRLRNEAKLLDVTFSAQNKHIKAHRVVLAAISAKCASQFSGLYRNEDVIVVDDDPDPDGCMSYHTLSTMIKFAYEDEIDWEEMEVSDSDDEDDKAEKLDLLLDLCKGADYWQIDSLMSQVQYKIVVAGKIFINLENVMDIRKRASHVRAKAVEEMCTEFILQNQEAVAKAHSGGSQ